jgi:cellulose synthase/poly-beta-1,6-N-acetylglucosamine synthase-like glycosyltransferase
MPEFCTCGAQLASDSLFCHKCGKPQREIVEAEPQAPLPQVVAAPPPPAPTAAPLPTFRNPVAMRIALMIAVFATLLSFLPYVNWLAAGYFAAFFYRRRTGSRLNLVTGVRMGWITGVLMFAITAALFTAFVVLFNASSGNAIFQAQIKSMTDPRVQEMFKMIQNRTEVAFLLMQLFVFVTCLSMAGGALGAKLAGRD